MQTLGAEISSPLLEWLLLPTAPKETVLCAGETTQLWEGSRGGGLVSFLNSQPSLKPHQGGREVEGAGRGKPGHFP